ncbi:DNA-binding transcriptional LysR family regulator [Silvimonas terrae]|uniref:DNA-binding transcriptional LysR family regulator n=1 Tax=Silvimonas terrae TaxID=300266 RepID=A0A840RAL5_9NEIS|nr:LysR family transcriptional regulator [Silvimonas terrae]MBB5189380.1 DNA-binding transcriptional LysR family regulator [Silvimonas terrae]
MPRLDLNTLIDLDALLTEGSVAGAARRLNISAPAMSRRLAHLRDALGDPLFVLAGRKLVPTERALNLQERVRAAVEDVRGLLVPQTLDLATVKATLVLRANDGFTGVWGIRLAERLVAEAPGVRLRFMPRAEKNFEFLRSGSADLELGVLDIDAPEIHNRALFDTRFVGVVRQGHPLIVQGRPVTVDDFVRWPHIGASRRGLACGPVDDALAVLGAERRLTAVAPGFQSALTMACASDFIATVPEVFARWTAPTLPLAIFPLPVSTPVVHVTMAWHPRRHADPLHRWLREHVLALSRELTA